MKLQTSATSGGSYAELSGATFTEITDAADSTQQILIDCDAITNPFLKCHFTVGGTDSPSFTCAVVGTGQKHG